MSDRYFIGYRDMWLVDLHGDRTSLESSPVIMESGGRSVCFISPFLDIDTAKRIAKTVCDELNRTDGGLFR